MERGGLTLLAADGRAVVGALRALLLDSPAAEAWRWAEHGVMMTTKQYYRLGIWLPLIVALLAAAVLALAQFLPMALYALFGLLLGQPVLAGVVGGAPYVVFALCASVWIRGRTEPEIRRCALWAPISFLPLFWLIAPFTWFGRSRFSLEDAIRVDLSMTPWVLVFGYAYVWLYFRGLSVLRRRGYISDLTVVSA